MFPKTILLAVLAHGASAEIPASLVAELKPTIVNIEVSVQHGLNTEGTGRHRGTGFIVDAERGIIATNRHVAGTSPGRIKIVFEDGQTAEAKHWYYDSWNDFAFLKLVQDETTKNLKLKAVVLGDSWKLKEQQDVLLIGNNDAQEYSVKFGKTANLYLCRDRRHSATIQTTFDRAGGSSGSPVFNADGEVVAIHFAGSATTSFEMRIEYIKDALEQLIKTGRVRRGELGLDLDIMLVSDAKKHYKLPQALAGRITGLREDLKRVAFVEFVAPESPAYGKLRPGDIILKAAGKWIGDDVYAFDKLVNGRVGKKISLSVARNGKELKVALPVLDAEKQKVRAFAQFAGATLHDITPDHRLRFSVVGDGVFLTQAEKGSSFAGLGREGSHTKYLLIIKGVNGIRTPDLKSFVKAVRGLKDGDYIYVEAQDRWRTQSITQAKPVRLDLKYYPLKFFRWSDKKLDWIPGDG